MLTDEQLIQQIRTELHAELAVLEPPADLLRRLAARAAAKESPPARVARLHLGAIVIAIGAACAIVVAVVALVSLGHRSPSVVVTGPQSSASRSTLGAVEAKLAVLRRPPTASDRGFPAYDLPRERLIRTRFAATVNTPTVGPMRVFVIVARVPAPRILQSSSRLRLGGDLVSAIAIPEHGRSISQTGSLRASSLNNPTSVGSGLYAPRSEADPSRGVTIGIVPDGVTRVQWIFTGAGFGITHPRPVTVYPQVHNNVAVAPVEPDEGPLARATWYGADGHVIATAAAANEHSEVQAIAAVNASHSRAISPWLLDHFALFTSGALDTPAQDPTLPTPGTDGGYEGEMELNYWQTRYVSAVTGLDGRGLWITPGARGVCVSDPQTTGCLMLSSRRRDGLIAISGTVAAHQETITGLVPNGNRTVTLLLSSGARKTVPVADHNVYEATVRGRVVAIIARNTSGNLEQKSLQ